MSQLSKSDYLLYLRHPAWLWLKKHRRSVLPKPDAALQALFDSGYRFEEFAEQRFPGAVKLGFKDFNEYRSLPRRTDQALADGADTIFQGRFESGRSTCIIDVLKRVEGGLFDLFEIKASTSAKPEHIPDLAFQLMVMEGAGVQVRNIGVIHVNRDYVRVGAVAIETLSMLTDVTDKVKRIRDETATEVGRALDILDLAEIPDVSPRYLKSGSMDEWMEIYEAVNGPLEKYSIYNLAGIRAEQVGRLEDAGVETLSDIPDDFSLTGRQERQLAAIKSGRRAVDGAAIKSFLGAVEYPLYFLDYETFSDVVPVVDGTRPYQHVPFQYSLHIRRTPGSELEHRAYLHEENTNPVPALLAQLVQDLGDTGSVIVWHDPFETRRNTEMGEMSPPHAEFLAGVNARVVDLIDPFKKGWFVDKDFFGSSSIKKVLPVLVPDLSYGELAIQDGEAARREWMDVVLNDKPIENRDQVFADLRTYCELDTMAMVRIFDVLEAL
ncbi:MAG: DUF2779 domain-containing protein [Hyphomicrobiaceae bacterium]